MNLAIANKLTFTVNTLVESDCIYRYVQVEDAAEYDLWSSWRVFDDIMCDIMNPLGVLKMLIHYKCTSSVSISVRYIYVLALIKLVTVFTLNIRTGLTFWVSK